MRFLIVGSEFMWTSGAYRLQEIEMEDVRVFCSEKEGKEHLQHIVEQVQTLEEGLRWVGTRGYVISEDEADMTPLRRRGFKVYGGNAWTKKVENDRQFEMQVAKKAGIRIPNFHHIKSVDEGIAFIKSHPDQYALKQEGHAPKTWNYVGKFEDGSDVIDQLEWIKQQPEFKKIQRLPFMLQEFVEGIEFAVGAWWMGKDWKRDDDGNVLLELNREHKKEGDGDIGRTTGEMGTVARLTTKHTQLFEETLELLTPALKENAADAVVDIDCNCGITDEGEAYLYEITPREGYPVCALQQYLLNTKLSDFLVGLIEGKQGDVEWKDAWGVITVVGAGQFPDEGESHEGSFKDQPVRMEITEHIAPFYIKYDPASDFYRIADFYEYVAGVCFHGDDIIETNKKCVEVMEKIDVRAPHFRRDIGTKFAKKEIPLLTKLGYL